MHREFNKECTGASVYKGKMKNFNLPRSPNEGDVWKKLLHCKKSVFYSLIACRKLTNEILKNTFHFVEQYFHAFLLTTSVSFYANGLEALTLTSFFLPGRRCQCFLSPIFGEDFDHR